MTPKTKAVDHLNIFFKVHIEVLCWFVQDTLKGDSVTELRVKFVRKIEDSVPPGDD